MSSAFPATPSRLSMGPTGYTGGKLVSENELIACVSNSKNVLTMIPLAFLSFRKELPSMSGSSSIWDTARTTFIGTGVTKHGTTISPSCLLSPIISCFLSTHNVSKYKLKPRNVQVEGKKTYVGRSNSLMGKGGLMRRTLIESLGSRFTSSFANSMIDII
ncbi:hypothetical protein HanXRQr2_Chr03g0135661 [Helianthus annuus]|uniref:Uncharacterized protein n=1 Tax=Helianthus annuus TaxID=4232 RepID=A0A9K3NZ45_HELAN|nr:hypothetical protein HanXRQr2_Chr03g0135661 [Helianthus annuus]